MPFQCTKCLHLTKDEEHKECKNRKECNFVRVSVIHFASPDGTGKLVGTGIRTVMEDGKAIVTPAELKLCCDAIETKHITNARYAATCLDCLERSKPVEPEVTPAEPTLI